MSTLLVYVLFDSLSERIVQTFFAPNVRYAIKQVNLFLKNNSNFDRKDFKLFEYGYFAFPENFKDLEDSEEVNIDEA